MIKQHKNRQGYVLIEALVALLVVMIGSLGIVKLNSTFLSSTATSKARAEATQLAGAAIEEIRNYAADAGCPAPTTLSGTHSGTAAAFKSKTVISAAAISPGISLQSCVAWDGSADPCTASSDSRVIVTSTVACVGVGTSGLVGGSSNAGIVSKLKNPTGSARVGGKDYGSLPTGATPNKVNGIDDGTYVYSADGKYELLDATGKVLLTIDDANNGTFSTISGRIFIDIGNQGLLVDPQGADKTTESDDNVFVLSSDASYCSRVFPSDPLPQSPASGTASYRYFFYKCYVSKGWWGNIGVIRLDTPKVDDRVCLGDPSAPTSDTSIWSRVAARAITRGYRAQRLIAEGQYSTIGIGISTTDGTSYTPINIPTTGTENHDFLITSLTQKEQCTSSVMSKNGTNNFLNNQGKFYCMSGQCSNLVQVSTPQTTVISGTITNIGGGVIAGLNDSDCTNPVFTPTSTGYTYSCTLNWAGFSGSSWQGAISFNTTGSNTICDASSAPTVAPSDKTVSLTVNDRLASVNPNSISFTDIPLGVTGITVNFESKPSSCQKLTTPALSFSKGKTPNDFVWNPVAGASGYKISKCKVNSATTCIPIDTGTQSNSPVASWFDNTTGTQTICLGVTATDSTNSISDSTQGTKCYRRTSKTKGAGFDYLESF